MHGVHSSDSGPKCWNFPGVVSNTVQISYQILYQTEEAQLPCTSCQHELSTGNLNSGRTCMSATGFLLLKEDRLMYSYVQSPNRIVAKVCPAEQTK